MNKLTGILTCTMAGVLLFSGCDKSESDVMPHDKGRIALYNDFFSTPVKTPVLLNILENDTITTSAELTIEQPVNGVLTPDTATGLYLFTPHNDHISDEEITYKVCKDEECKTATVRIKVVEVGSCIVEAQPDVAFTSFPDPVTINVLANDRTCGRIKLLPAQNVAGGTVQFTPDKRGFIFTPTNPAVKTGSFIYKIEGSNGSSFAKVTIQVNATITASCIPVLRNDTIIAPNLGYHQSTTLKTVTLNDDIYSCGSSPHCEIVAQPAHGEAEGSYYDINGVYSNNYHVKYKRLDLSSDSDTFTYQVKKIIDGEVKYYTAKVVVLFPTTVVPTNNLEGNAK